MANYYTHNTAEDRAYRVNYTSDATTWTIAGYYCTGSSQTLPSGTEVDDVDVEVTAEDLLYEICAGNQHECINTDYHAVAEDVLVVKWD